ncbi:flagellin-like hook-associated protein FlgL [Bacillus sp. SORGH_AS 510]|uniref:flagellin N-terminal helical domain-containing protein n=1 Tax=Bacillus sp. SORGH_AS_0510 TaxID=3041771 RepID=UPI0027805E3A|nr:hypothetical protein [Bacillus sp. SORGH_AS_0510]MDQ1146292.1 flagellin-like hook-associated protein FlgL [Bacillus sp. SORGH_AS_0510]
MSLRVTQNMLNQNLLFNLQRTNKTMDQLQEQVSSGRKINKPSDNPCNRRTRYVLPFIFKRNRSV